MFNRWKIYLCGLACFVALARPYYGQNANTLTLTGNGNPVGTCAFIMRYVDTLNGNLWACNPTTSAWVFIGPGAGAGISTINPGGNGGPAVAFATGTTGVDFNVAGGANVVTFHLPTADGTHTGKLSSGDWTTFNGKQPALTTHACGAGDFISAFTSPNTFTCGTPSGGFPRLDQVTDPNVAKTFNLGANDLAFTGAKVTVGTGAANHVFNVYCTTNDCVGINSTGIDSNSMLHIENVGVQGPFFDFHSATQRWAWGVGSDGHFQIRNSLPATDPVNGTTLFHLDTTGDYDVVGGQNKCVAASASGTAYTCNTVGGLTPIVGGTLTFVPDVDSGATPTLAVNGGAAGGIYHQGGTTQVGATELKANKPVLLLFDAAGHWDMSDLNISAGGFPRLDQVLNPNASKNFAMGTNNLIFGGDFRVDWNFFPTTVDNGDFFNITAEIDFAPSSSQIAGFSNTVSALPSADSGFTPYGIKNVLTHDSSSTHSIGGIIGIDSVVRDETNLGTTFPTGIESSTRGRADSDVITSGYFFSGNMAGATGSTITAAAVQTENDANALAAIGLEVWGHQNPGGGTTTTNYGIKIEDQTAGSTNYAIKTGLGQNSFGDKTTGTRFSVANATALVSGDFALSGSWGNTASIGSIRGTDQAWSGTVTSTGTGQANAPTVDLTFKDGTWTTVPVYVCKQSNGSGTVSDVTYTVSATHLILTWLATPVAATTYEFSCIGMGI